MNIPLELKLSSGTSADDPTVLESGWVGLARAVSTWSRPVTIGSQFVLVFAVGLIDYLTGVELSVSLLYLVPITIGTWVAGRAGGNSLALTSAVVWLGADSLARQTYGHWFLPVWNTFTLAASFLVVVALLASLREANEVLEQTVARRTKALQAENAERRRAEIDLRHALDDVRKTHSELQRTQFQLIEGAKMESVGRLAAGVAHEVKNPLMTLSLGADYFLHQKAENAEEAQLVGDMKEAVHRASKVINVLLDYARPRPLQRTNEDIHEIIDDSLTLVRHQLNKQHVTVAREFDKSLPPVLLDRSRIEQVVVNLFVNALHAMAPGGTVTVRTLAVAPFGRPSEASTVVTVEVDDTGHGIMPENLGRVFDPFFTTKPTVQGTGLGLAIVRRIMEIHGGSVALGESNPGWCAGYFAIQNRT